MHTRPKLLIDGIKASRRDREQREALTPAPSFTEMWASGGLGAVHCGDTEECVPSSPRESGRSLEERTPSQALKVEDEILSVGKTGERTVDSQRGPGMHRNRVKKFQGPSGKSSFLCRGQCFCFACLFCLVVVFLRLGRGGSLRMQEKREKRKDVQISGCGRPLYSFHLSTWVTEKAVLEGALQCQFYFEVSSPEKDFL